jgi:hypothetical protein
MVGVEEGRTGQDSDIATGAQFRERPNERFGLDDSSIRRVQRGSSPHMRLSRADELCVDDSEPARAIRLAACLQFLEFVEFAVVLNDDELSAPIVRDAVRLAKLVQHPRAFDAQSRLEGADGIVDARVNHLTVVSARAHAWARFTLENADAVTALRYRAGCGEPDDTGADHRDVYV